MKIIKIHIQYSYIQQPVVFQQNPTWEAALFKNETYIFSTITKKIPKTTVY